MQDQSPNPAEVSEGAVRQIILLLHDRETHRFHATLFQERENIPLVGVPCLRAFVFLESVRHHREGSAGLRAAQKQGRAMARSAKVAEAELWEGVVIDWDGRSPLVLAVRNWSADSGKPVSDDLVDITTAYHEALGVGLFAQVVRGLRKT